MSPRSWATVDALLNRGEYAGRSFRAPENDCAAWAAGERLIEVALEVGDDEPGRQVAA